MPHASFAEKQRFLLKLGRMLHRFGTPAYRLEGHLQEVAQILGIQASFAVSPTLLTFVTQEPGETHEHVHVARVLPGELDLGSLSRTDEVVEAVARGGLGLDAAMARLEAIEAMPNPYGRALSLAAFAGAGAAFALLMRCSWANVGWAALLSALVYAFVCWAEASSRITRMLEPLVALVSALVATALAATVDPGLQVPMVVLSSIIVFIPGLALTLGFAELAARQVMSGTGRVMDGAMLLFKLYFGAFLGIALGHRFFGKVADPGPAQLPAWSSWLAVAALCAALVVVFRARPRHAPWGILSGFIGYGASLLGAALLGPALGAFVGAFLVGLYGNVFSRVSGVPASIVTLQGMIVLVPGSKTYMGLNALISGERMVATGQLGQDSFLIFMSLVAGFIFSLVLLPPRKSL